MSTTPTHVDVEGVASLWTDPLGQDLSDLDRHFIRALSDSAPVRDRRGRLPIVTAAWFELPAPVGRVVGETEHMPLWIGDRPRRRCRITRSVRNPIPETSADENATKETIIGLDTRSVSDAEDRSARVLSLLLQHGDALRKLCEELAHESGRGVREHAGFVWLPEPVFIEAFAHEGERDAPDELIVQVARRAHGTLADTLTRLRRILRRDRRIEPVARVQQLDAACLRWLVRQPGRTPEEMAGPRQQVMAVVRESSFNTLENRVVKDFMRLCRIETRRYLGAYRHRFPHSGNVRRVIELDACCRHGLALQELENVAGIDTMPTPNYVLQFDDRYRELWQWYRKLRRREQQKTELWRWRHRAWAELVEFDMIVACWQMADPRTPFEGEIGLRRDPERGRYRHAGSSVAPVLVDGAWVRASDGTADGPVWADFAVHAGPSPITGVRSVNVQCAADSARSAAWSPAAAPPETIRVLVGDWEEIGSFATDESTVSWPIGRSERMSFARDFLRQTISAAADDAPR